MSEEPSEVKPTGEELSEAKKSEEDAVIEKTNEDTITAKPAEDDDTKDLKEINDAFLWKKRAEAAESQLQALKLSMEKSQQQLQQMRVQSTPLSAVSSPVVPQLSDNSSGQSTAGRLDRARIKMGQCISSLNEAAESMQHALFEASTIIINSGSAKKTVGMPTSASMVNISGVTAGTASSRKSGSRRLSVGSQKVPEGSLSARGPTSSSSSSSTASSAMPPRSMSVENIADHDNKTEHRQRLSHSSRMSTGPNSGLRSSVMPNVMRMRQQQMQRQGDASMDTANDEKSEKIAATVSQIESASMSLMDATTAISARTRHILEAMSQLQATVLASKLEKEERDKQEESEKDLLYMLYLRTLAVALKDGAVKDGVSCELLRSVDDLYDMAKSENVPVLELPRWVRKNIIISSQSPPKSTSTTTTTNTTDTTTTTTSKDDKH